MTDKVPETQSAVGQTTGDDPTAGICDRCDAVVYNLYEVLDQLVCLPCMDELLDGLADSD